MATSAAFCTSSPWIENFTMLRFIVSQPSTERSSAMRFSSSAGSSVGIDMPGSGTPSGPHRRRNISNGSCGGVSAMDLAFWARSGGDFEQFLHLGGPAHRVLVAEVDHRAAERLLEQQVAGQVGAGAVERAGRAQDEAHGARQ